MDPMLIVIALCVGLVAVFVGFALLFEYGNLWVVCRISNAPIPFGRMLRWRFRHRMAREQVRELAISRIRLARAKVDVPIASLEAHALAGLETASVASSVIAAGSAGIPLTWDQAAARHRAGEDVLASIQDQARAVIDQREAAAAS